MGDSVPDSGFHPPVDDTGEFEVEQVLDHCRVCHGRVWVDEYLVKWVGYGLFEATWEPSAQLSNAPTALANFLATQGGPHVGTHVSRGGGVMLGFDVWFCLFVAVCSAVVAVYVCVYTLHVLCAYYASAMCVGQIYKRG